jgi:hypothetical protein
VSCEKYVLLLSIGFLIGNVIALLFHMNKLRRALDERDGKKK